jgi:hypothetical protein
MRLVGPRWRLAPDEAASGICRKCPCPHATPVGGGASGTTAHCPSAGAAGQVVCLVNRRLHFTRRSRCSSW